jgi:hypothetical protein
MKFVVLLLFIAANGMAQTASVQPSASPVGTGNSSTVYRVIENKNNKAVGNVNVLLLRDKELTIFTDTIYTNSFGLD